MPSRPIHLSWSQYDPHFPSASHAGSVLVSPVATTSPFATWPPTGTDARRRTPTGCCDVVGGTGLGAGHSTDDVADRSNVVVEVGARADDRRTLVADLLQALRGHRLERSTDDREAFQQVGEVGGAEGEETAVRGRPDAGHSSPSS